jgi:hypothetical protein
MLDLEMSSGFAVGNLSDTVYSVVSTLRGHAELEYTLSACSNGQQYALLSGAATYLAVS